MLGMYTTLISAAELQQLQNSQRPRMVFDCSFALQDPNAGPAQFEEAHIAGAVFANLDQHLSSHDADDQTSGGRHPLPSRETFAAWLVSIGFGPDTQAVVYDRQGVNYAGRLWWMLKWCGHEAVAVLDGGFQAWQSIGGAVASGPSQPTPEKPGAFQLRPPLVSTVSTSDILDRLGRPSQTLIDARAEARFRGEMEPMDPIAGHIPGALNRPFPSNLGPDGRFKSAETLRAEFNELLAGRDPAGVVHHCGSGVSAIPNLLAMEIAGLGRSALYPGSWSEWSNTAGTPCAQSSSPDSGR